MAIWGAVLGFLLLLYVATEIISEWQANQISTERQHATAAALEHVKAAVASPNATQSSMASNL